MTTGQVKRTLTELLSESPMDPRTVLMGPDVRQEFVLDIMARLDAAIEGFPAKFLVRMRANSSPEALREERFGWISEAFVQTYHDHMEDLLQLVAAGGLVAEPNRPVTVVHVLFMALYCVHALTGLYIADSSIPVIRAFDMLANEGGAVDTIRGKVLEGMPFVALVYMLPGHFMSVHSPRVGAITIYDTTSSPTGFAKRLAASLMGLNVGLRVEIVTGLQGSQWVSGENICGYIAAHDAAWISMSHSRPPRFNQGCIEILRTATRVAISLASPSGKRR